MTSRRSIPLALSLVVVTSALPPAAAQPPAAATEATDEPRYLAAVRQELQRLAIEAECEVSGRARAVCTFRHERLDREVRIVVSDAKNTVYLAVMELGRIDPQAADAGDALRRLAELDWELTSCRLSWDPRTGAVRLAAVQHTDTNFDRRTFRVLMRLLLGQAERLAPALSRE